LRGSAALVLRVRHEPAAADMQIGPVGGLPSGPAAHRDPDFLKPGRWCSIVPMEGSGLDNWPAFAAANGMDQRLALMHEAILPLGFSSLVYDYTAVACTPERTLIRPNIMRTVNLPGSFETLWMEENYFAIDLVQQVCQTTSRPFVWSHFDGQNRIRGRSWAPEQQPVVRYLRDTRLTCGVTVPIRLPGGGLATVTGIRIDAEPSFPGDARHNIAAFTLLALELNEALYADFDDDIRTCQHVRLTRREIECLSLSAQGLTAEAIAERIGRSLPTVTLHLNSAARKLGARNRAQAIALASHYRLLRTLN
jgi:LuxR family transcriptional regulator